MSNRASIVPTEFVNVRDGTKTCGYRIYDDYAQSYNNTWEDIPEDDMDILKQVIKEADDIGSGIIDSVVENEKGICIGEHWYDWDEIKDVLKE